MLFCQDPKVPCFRIVYDAEDSILPLFHVYTCASYQARWSQSDDMTSMVEEFLWLELELNSIADLSTHSDFRLPFPICVEVLKFRVWCLKIKIMIKDILENIRKIPNHASPNLQVQFERAYCLGGRFVIYVRYCWNYAWIRPWCVFDICFERSG